MIRVTTYIFLILAFLGCKKKQIISDSQSQKFVKYFGSFSQDNGNHMLQTDDEGFLIVGSVSSLTDGKEAAIIKTDKFGNEEWSKTFGDSLNNYANNVIIENDGYLVFGTTTNEILNTDMWLLKLSKAGRFLWQRKYDKGANEEGIGIVKSNDNGYILAGTSTASNFNGNPAGNKDVYCIKIDDTGKEIWSYNYGASGNDYCEQIISYNNGYAIIGSSNSYGTGNYEIFVLLINEDGGSPANETFGGINNSYGNSILNTDNGFVVIGTSFITGATSQTYCAEIENNGISLPIIWEANYGEENNETGNHIIETSTGNFLITGSSEQSGMEKQQYLINVSSSGDTSWTNVLGYTGDDVANFALETVDGGFAILGTTTFENNQMVSLIKTDSKGQIIN